LRVTFPTGMQRHFVEYTKLRSRLSWREFRSAVGIGNHRNYRYEVTSLPFEVFERALKVGRVTKARAKRFRYRVIKVGAENLIQLPQSKDLAELVGICVGDGHLRPCVMSVFGDKFRDTVYLQDHVLPLVQRVLRVRAKVNRARPDENFVVLYSASASRSLHAAGLPFGDKIKNRARIPEWVFKKKTFLRACLRGLLDTDGCIYGFRRKSRGSGSKAIISFEFGSGSFLAADVETALRQLGYLPRMMPHRNECRLAYNKDIVRFMNEIRPANEKHRKNFLRWHGPVV
jgi:hypothetical protein